jgi:phosphotransacetylase/acyl dehydratase
MDYIENRTFDSIQIGDSAHLVRRLTLEDIKLFAVISGDANPAHMDRDYARSSRFHDIIAHGLWGGSLISAVLGMQLPGPGTIYLGQNLRFHRPVRIGDQLTVTVTAKTKDAAKNRIIFDCACTNQNGEVAISGEAEVIAPTEKVHRPRSVLPQVHLVERVHLHRLLEAAKAFKPITTAVVHPVDRQALLGAISAAKAGLIHPVLVGPEKKIRLAAEANGLDLEPYPIISTEHSHAAAAEAVKLVRAGKAEALMKGSLQTDELMEPVLADAGLRTARRMSHVFVFDVPTYPRPLFITDAAINLYPTLDDKRDIVQNAIDLAHAVGIGNPKVAILSAVETVKGKLQSTVEAAALCKMAERGQITGGMLDGPLAFDDAISGVAARAKGINSPVAGHADILVAPDLESATMLSKQLEYLADAQGAGIVLGARVPIILTNRADESIIRIASCALAVVLAHRERQAEQDSFVSGGSVEIGERSV